MQRVFWLIVFVLLGLTLLTCGLLVPAHLRAVDAAVVQQAGANTRSLVQEGNSLLGLEKWGAAQMFWQVARADQLPGQEKLGAALTNFSLSHPQLMVWGGADPDLETVIPPRPSAQPSGIPSAFDLIEQPASREKILDWLRISPRPVIQELLQIRLATNTTLFPPATSVSGQALDTILMLTGVLMHGGHIAPALQEEIYKLTAQANRAHDYQDVERVMLDLLSLSKRFNWVQLSLFIRQIEDLPTLRRLALLVRENETAVPVIFAAVTFSSQPASVAGYLTEYNLTGVKDLRFGLGAGLGGLKELLATRERIYYPKLREQLVQYDPWGTFFYAILGWCRVALWAALVLKYLFFLAGGFLLANAYHLAKPAASALERPLQVPGLAPARQVLMAFCLLLVILFLNEPFLAQENQHAEYPLRLSLLKVSNAVLAETPPASNPIMNQIALLSLLLFFVLQALIYIACLIKLAEIRRQNVGPRLKLKLLENEDHLFDAGLYLGFVGTIIALILMSMRIVEPSLMAGYSSTSFGIIFVSILKIFHVRPLRRKLILESETSLA
jgi:hypothetical protein